MRTGNRVFMAAAAVLAALATSCAKPAAGPRPPEPGLFDGIPADTPYLFATLDPIPPPVMARMVRQTAPMLEAMAGADDDPSDFMSTFLRTFAAEMLRLMTPEGAREAGLTPGTQFVVWGHGPWPVWRTLLADPVRYEGYLLRQLQRFKVPYTRGEVAGRHAVHFTIVDRWTVTSIVDGKVGVTAILPSSTPSAELHRALGLERPARVLDAAGMLRKLARERGWLGYMIAVVDTRRLVASVLQRDEVDADCRAEAVELAGVAPHIEFGYTRLTEDAVDGEMHVELRPDLARELARVQADGALRGGQGTPLMEVGASADPAAVMEFLRRRGRAIAASPYRCPLLQGMNRMSSLAEAELPPFLDGVRGVRAAVQAFDLSAQKVDAWVMVRARDPLGLARMLGATAGADLSGLRDGGPPVPLALGGFLPPATVAVKGERLVLVLGPSAAVRVRSLLDSELDHPAPLFSMTYDYAQVMSAMGGLLPATRGQTIGSAFSSLGRVSFDTSIGRGGLTLKTRMKLR